MTMREKPIVTEIASDIELPQQERQTREERRAYERANYAANAERIRERKRKDYQKNPEKALQRHKRYREQNPEKRREIQRKSIAKNPAKRAETIRNYINKRSAVDPEFKLLRDLRARLRKVISGKAKTGHMVDLLGCSMAELRIHIEKQWLPGMNWANRSFRGWHIDHIKPLSTFDLSDPVELAKACHFTNLQPLWWRDNLEKGNKSYDRM